MIGLFDSGLGGLTVLRELRKQLADFDMLFFADQANVPYGDKSAAELQQILAQNVAFMNEEGVEAIVMACNTSCAIADQYGWPQSRAKIFDLIDAAADVVERESYKNIGVIATAATARSGAYGRRIRSRLPNVSVAEIAAPTLVPLVEAGKLSGAEPRHAVQEVCAALPAGVDAVILACTHYPLLRSHFASVLGDRVALIDPAIEQAARVAAFAKTGPLQSGSGSIRCITSGDVTIFRPQVRSLLGASAERAVISEQTK